MEKLLSEQAITVVTGDAPSFAVIWLHGLGADGSDFVPLVPELGLPDSLSGRFIFPHAPYRPVTCNGGYEMRAWYDILSLEPDNRRIDGAGLLASRKTVRQLIDAEVAQGISPRRIFIAGFSQGGAVAYTTALTHPEPLGGLIALSTYIPDEAILAREGTGANLHIPIFAAHGSQDDVVSPALGKKARDFLVGQGRSPEWHSYPMPHSVCLEEVEDISAWLQRLLEDDRLAPTE